MIKRICFLLSLLMCGVLYAQDITYRTVKDLSYSSSKDPYATGALQAGCLLSGK